MKQLIIEQLEKRRTPRGVWHNAVIDDALSIIECWPNTVIIDAVKNFNLRKLLLNGAQSWKEYSYGGSALVYDYDIARHYCMPCELRKTQNGNRQPNKRETWLDVQARALSQAARIVCGIAYHIYDGAKLK